jgi:hypothetical protein
VNVENRNSVRRRGLVLVRSVLGLATAAAGGVTYVLADTGRVEWIVLPLIAAGLLGFVAALYSRARNRREWSAAWDAYAAGELKHETARSSVRDDALAWAGTN